MAKAEWGVKRLCQSCGAKFYDMLKDPITCPACGAVFDPENLRPRRPRGNAKAAKPAAATGKAAGLDEDLETGTDDEELAAAELDDNMDETDGEDDLLADTEDLEDDDDKIPAVVVSRDEDES